MNPTLVLVFVDSECRKQYYRLGEWVRDSSGRSRFKATDPLGEGIAELCDKFRIDLKTMSEEDRSIYLEVIQLG